jgi:uncharacterized protein YecE (DUF72 family)
VPSAGEKKSEGPHACASSELPKHDAAVSSFCRGKRGTFAPLMLLHIGTSGYGYKEWVGTFYPAGLKPKAMLAHYATKLDTVEINYTFRRMPTAALLSGWAAQVPESFTFVLKAPERITHRAKLKDAREPTQAFVTAAQTLGPRLGALLFQLPPYAKKDVGVLRTFLEDLRGGPRAAFEFRHPSWLEDDALAALREHGAALCLSESDDTAAGADELEAPLIATADWGYLRLRRTDYSDADLVAWGKRLRAQPWSRAFVFLKHEDAGKGPIFAAKLRDILGIAPL